MLDLNYSQKGYVLSSKCFKMVYCIMCYDYSVSFSLLLKCVDLRECEKIQGKKGGLDR